MGTFVVLVVLISVVALIVRGIVRDKKSGKSSAVGTVHIAEAAIRYSDQHKFQVIKKGMV